MIVTIQCTISSLMARLSPSRESNEHNPSRLPIKRLTSKHPFAIPSDLILVVIFHVHHHSNVTRFSPRFNVGYPQKETTVARRDYRKITTSRTIPRAQQAKRNTENKRRQGHGCIQQQCNSLCQWKRRRDTSRHTKTSCSKRMCRSL